MPPDSGDDSTYMDREGKTWSPLGHQGPLLGMIVEANMPAVHGVAQTNAELAIAHETNWLFGRKTQRRVEDVLWHNDAWQNDMGGIVHERVVVPVRLNLLQRVREDDFWHASGLPAAIGSLRFRGWESGGNSWRVSYTLSGTYK